MLDRYLQIRESFLFIHFLCFLIRFINISESLNIIKYQFFFSNFLFILVPLAVNLSPYVGDTDKNAFQCLLVKTEISPTNLTKSKYFKMPFLSCAENFSVNYLFMDTGRNECAVCDLLSCRIDFTLSVCQRSQVHRRVHLKDNLLAAGCGTALQAMSLATTDNM